jgi:hypothetical protein
VTIAARIAAHQAAIEQLCALERLVLTIGLTIGRGIAFSAAELFDHRIVSPGLAAAFTAAGVRSPKTLGKKLRQCCGGGIERVGVEHGAALWLVP